MRNFLILALCAVGFVFAQPQEPSIEALIRENATLTEQIRVLTIQLRSTEAQIEEMRATPAAPEKSRWFGYTSPVRRGAFDMLEVSRWEGVQIQTQLATNWSYLVHFRGDAQPPVHLTDAMFKDFAVKFDSYLQRP